MTHSPNYRDANPLFRFMRTVGGTKPMSRYSARTLHHVDRLIFRLTKGRTTMTSMTTGFPVVMLTTTGAKSGVARTLPLLGLPDGDRIAVIASNYGQHDNPGWYYNLRKQPAATITVAGGTPRTVRAYEAEGDERERLWQKGLDVYPGWAGYERRATDRRIPVMVLEPEASAD
ncbi:nitroreductase family deazaflavin-dependent oxidoreductase [Rhodococcus daqingensis]|uniref:Nitroreductase family deazaflavin-dependent oxidoreductase n=1 Tax=Rhodococcus daqingensis TaxID=2479363 RepID=A0ABW2RRM4_9NOCA